MTSIDEMLLEAESKRQQATAAKLLAEAEVQRLKKEEEEWAIVIKRFKELVAMPKPSHQGALSQIVEMGAGYPSRQKVIETAKEYFLIYGRAKEAKQMIPFFADCGYVIDKDRLRKIMWDERSVFDRNEKGWGLKVDMSCLD